MKLLYFEAKNIVELISLELISLLGWQWIMRHWTKIEPTQQFLRCLLGQLEITQDFNSFQISIFWKIFEW